MEHEIISYLKNDPWRWHSYNDVAKGINQAENWKEVSKHLLTLKSRQESKIRARNGGFYRHSPMPLGGEQDSKDRVLNYCRNIQALVKQKPNLSTRQIISTIRDLRGTADQLEIELAIRILEESRVITREGIKRKGAHTFIAGSVDKAEFQKAFRKCVMEGRKNA